MGIGGMRVWTAIGAKGREGHEREGLGDGPWAAGWLLMALQDHKGMMHPWKARSCPMVGYTSEARGVVQFSG